MSGRACVPAVLLAVLFVWTPCALALDRMGPAAGQLGQGKFSIGLDYAFSDTDLNASGQNVYTDTALMSGEPVTSHSYKNHSVTMDRVNINRLYATAGYGLLEQTDLFVRLGGAQIRYKDDGGIHPALSGGVRSTVYTNGDLQIGGLAQVSWSEAAFRAIPFSSAFHRGVPIAMRGDLSLYEIQAALAASYRIAEPFSIYGGPFLYFVSGQLDLQRDRPWIVWVPESIAQSLKSSYDLEETCRMGIYLGAECKITSQVTLGIEYQYTPDAEAITTGLAWRL